MLILGIYFCPAIPTKRNEGPGGLPALDCLHANRNLVDAVGQD